MLRGECGNNQFTNIAKDFFISESLDSNMVLLSKISVSLRILFLSVSMPVGTVALDCHAVVRQKEVNPVHAESAFPFILNTKRLEALLHNRLYVRSPLLFDFLEDQYIVSIPHVLAGSAFFAAKCLWGVLRSKLAMTEHTLFRLPLSSRSPTNSRAILSGGLFGCGEFLAAYLANMIACILWEAHGTFAGVSTLHRTMNYILASRTSIKGFVAMDAYLLTHGLPCSFSSRYFCNAHTSSPLNDLWFFWAFFLSASTISAGTWTVIFCLLGFVFMLAFYHKNASIVKV
jgi:hypothetical protein